MTLKQISFQIKLIIYNYYLFLKKLHLIELIQSIFNRWGITMINYDYYS